MTACKVLQEKLGYHFKNETLLVRALTHRSKQKLKNNERLEFLGDSVLSLIISTELFNRYDKLREGELSRLRAALVKGETIAKLAFSLGMQDALELGIGELKSGGQLRESILAGAFEAVIGAVYCDADYETAQLCVLQWYGDLISKIDTHTDIKDAKTTLQEWLQGRQMSLPVYACSMSGDAHAQTFKVTCCVSGFSFETCGKSTTRRKAEQLAAKKFLEKLNE